MFKRILAVAVAALVVFFFVWERGTTKTAYVNGLATYQDLPRRQFIFERDCYIFKLKDQRIFSFMPGGPDTDYPLVGDHAVVPALPEQVDEKYVGANLPGVRILGITHVGDRFRIVSVRRDITRGQTKITFEVLFANEAEWKYPRLDTYWIMDHTPEASGGAPSLRRDYAAERASD